MMGWVVNSALAKIDKLPLLALVPAAIVGWVLGRVLGAGFVGVLFFALIAAIVRYFVAKAKQKKLARQAQFVASVHDAADGLAATITAATGDLEQASQDLGFAEATFGTALLAPRRAAIAEAYSDIAEARRIQESLAGFDGAANRDVQAELSRAEALCAAVFDKTTSQHAEISAFQDAVRHAPKTLRALGKEIGVAELRLAETRNSVAKLETADGLTLLNQAELKLKDAKEALKSAQAANDVEDKSNFLNFISQSKSDIGEVNGKLDTLNAFIKKITAQQEQARQEAKRLAELQAEQERAAAAQRELHDATMRALDSVSGLGPKRREAILEHFGSLDAVRRASPQQLTQVNTIGPGLAQAIWNALRDVR